MKHGIKIVHNKSLSSFAENTAKNINNNVGQEEDNNKKKEELIKNRSSLIEDEKQVSFKDSISQAKNDYSLSIENTHQL